MSNLDTAVFPLSTWPLEFSWFLKIFDFVNFDIFASLVYVDPCALQPKVLPKLYIAYVGSSDIFAKFIFSIFVTNVCFQVFENHIPWQS